MEQKTNRGLGCLYATFSDPPLTNPVDQSNSGALQNCLKMLESTPVPVISEDGMIVNITFKQLKAYIDKEVANKVSETLREMVVNNDKRIYNKRV